MRSLNNLYASPFVRMITSRKIRWAGQVAQTENCEMYTKFWSKYTKVRVHLKEVDVHERIALEWILEKYVGREWTGSIWLRIGISGELLLTR